MYESSIKHVRQLMYWSHLPPVTVHGSINSPESPQRGNRKNTGRTNVLLSAADIAEIPQKALQGEGLALYAVNALPEVVRNLSPSVQNIESCRVFPAHFLGVGEAQKSYLGLSVSS